MIDEKPDTDTEENTQQGLIKGTIVGPNEHKTPEKLQKIEWAEREILVADTAVNDTKLISAASIAELQLKAQVYEEVSVLGKVGHLLNENETRLTKTVNREEHISIAIILDIVGIDNIPASIIQASQEDPTLADRALALFLARLHNDDPDNARVREFLYRFMGASALITEFKRTGQPVRSNIDNLRNIYEATLLQNPLSENPSTGQIVDGFLDKNSQACDAVDGKGGPIESIKQLQSAIGGRTAMKKPTMDELNRALGAAQRRRR